jgi:hypothetical protein
MRDLPKIVKDAARVRAMIEVARTRMARVHRHESGRDLRRAAARVVRRALGVWRAKSLKGKVARGKRLAAAIDSLKLELQLCKDVNAFRSWNEFEAVVRLVDEVGRQSGGWLKRLTPKGQSARAVSPPGQRAPILSSRSASQGASL